MAENDLGESPWDKVEQWSPPISERVETAVFHAILPNKDDQINK